MSSIPNPPAHRSPASAVGRLESFVCQRSLPLWAKSGFDWDARGFHERLDFQGNAIKELPRRMMVQARQIVVYARSSMLGWYDDREHCALVAFEAARKKYHSPDGNAGWVFSIYPDGTIADPTRDLYAHAFVLYMLAWVYQLHSDKAVLALADATLSEIGQIFPTMGLGYLSRVPGANDIREQNPHMHLLEALIALAEASGAERYLARANAIVDLFDNVLADPVTGTVREIFDADWRSQGLPGTNLIEPGHQFEWAWLLREWGRLAGRAVDDRVNRLMTHATAYGIDATTGLVRSSVQEDGRVRSAAARVWPQTEAIRALCREDSKGTKWPSLVAAITDNLFEAHLPAKLNGGWIDQILDGRAAIDFMPASTLYHLVGAAIDGKAALS